MKSVVQEETTGCGIASVANIVNKSYAEMKETANAMGIHASDDTLWSDTRHVRQLLSAFGAQTSAIETPFSSWSQLPDLALLAIKHHQDNGRHYWHWVVSKDQKTPKSCWIQPAICRRTYEQTLIKCSQLGLLRLNTRANYRALAIAPTPLRQIDTTTFTKSSVTPAPKAPF